MPIAVFYTEDRKDAIKLFCRLYKKTWYDLVKEDGILVIREEDIPYEDLKRICGNKEPASFPPVRRASRSEESEYCYKKLRQYFRK